MKGIVFTGLSEMIEAKFGMDTLNEVISNSNSSTNGAYSAVGTYDFQELISLVVALSKKTGIEPDKLVHAYGRYFFDILLNGYPDFFNVKSSFEFLKTIDSHIHVEVKKLYPDAELPVFEYIEGGNILKLTYKSERKLSKFALGLIERTIEHYKENISVTEEKPSDDGQVVEFTLVKL